MNYVFRRNPIVNRILAASCVFACCAAVQASLAAAETPTVVEVKPGQTLNEAIAGVAGPICVLLPAGVTEHDAAITRATTVIVKGQGRDVSILRPSAGLGPDKGVALVQHNDPFDGDLILSDFTYNRAHHPGVTPGKEAKPTTGATILHVGAEGRVILRNLAIYHFDFGARENQETATTAFVMARPGQRAAWVLAGRQPDEYHQEEIRFENVLIDFEKDGGIRHRPGVQARAFSFGLVDRLVFDADCVVRGHLCQDANPEYTVGPVWRDRGNAGTMYGMAAAVYEYALIDGVYWNCDYGVSRTVDAATEDAVIEWRMDVLNAGYGDQFWQGRLVNNGGHMIFKDVRLVGNRTGELWNDYGIRAEGSWKTITVDGCTVINRGNPLTIVNHHDAQHQKIDQITIRNTTLVPVGGGGPGLTIGDYKEIGGLCIDGLNIYADLESEEGYFNTAIKITEVGDGGGFYTISNVRADGYLYNILDANLGSNTVLKTSNIHGVRVTPDTLVEHAEPVAVYPEQGRSFEIDGVAEPLDWEPIATIEDFKATEPFEKLDLYLAFDPGPGVFVRVVVAGDSHFGNSHDYPTKLYRGDAVQFFITRGRPGEVVGGTVWNIAKHDEQGVTAYRYNFWPDQELPEGVVDIPIAIEYDPDRDEIVYEFMLPWEQIGMPAPWYEDICVDLVVADDQAYGAHYKGASWQHSYGEGIGHAIFHPEAPRSRGAKWIRFRQEDK